MENKKLRVGICGCGSISRSHMDAYRYHADKVDVVSCCDINKERAEAYAKEFGIPNAYGSIEEMLAGAELDAVSVTTWNNGHAPCAIAALRAGKNVLCEKPMTMSAELGRQMKEEADKAGKLLMIGFVRRFWENAQIVNDFIKAGRVGDIFHVDTVCLRRAGNPTGWFSDKKRSGGGPVIDLGVHMIDLGRYLMGKPNPVSVYASTYNKLGTRLNLKHFPRYTPVDKDDYCDVEDFCTAMIRFDNGATMNVQVSFSAHIKEDVLYLRFQGDKGGAQLDPTVELYSEMDDYAVDIAPKYTPDPVSPFTVGFRNEIGHFIDCVQNGTPCLNTADDGIQIMKILDAIYESAATGHEVVIK